MPLSEYRRNGLRIALGSFVIGALIGAVYGALEPL